MRIALLASITLFLLLIPALPVGATGSVCAVVKIEIQQELALERQGFDARMRIQNGLDTTALTDVGINVTFADRDGNSVLATSDTNNVDALFYINVDSMDGISDVSGTGVVQPASTAEVHWLIVPAQGAGGQLPSGELYFIGATLSYTVGGEVQTVEVTPDSIYVKPLPLLSLDYFLTADVYADDAFTQEIEPPEPFTLGVRIRNNGYGPAYGVSIGSGQPKIVENEQGLLIGFSITGASVNDAPTTVCHEGAQEDEVLRAAMLHKR
ncbi:hypothetical protein MNBD_GAMMA26-2330 [hydrothermal vent metagenome]|uniref:Uncharacterized protein n=1 Tax=hydrothermal vent metagenome TaxID=652676 RepID=A0A3B1BCM1_9ZZZZ